MATTRWNRWITTAAVLLLALIAAHNPRSNASPPAPKIQLYCHDAEYSCIVGGVHSETNHEGAAGQDPRALIRDAALRQFARHGFKGATIRGIADDAGVSAGMVQHHFPSKRALREECDAHVLAVVREVKDLGVVGGAASEAGFMAGAHRGVLPVVGYLAMAMLSDTPTASTLFTELAELYGDTLISGEAGPAIPPDEDATAIAAVHTAMQLGLAILAKQVYEHLGADPDDPAALARIGRARLYLAAERTVDERVEAWIREGLDRYADDNRAAGHEAGENP